MSHMDTFEAYLAETHKVAQYAAVGTKGITEKAYLALGLAGESGEAVDCVKKLVRNCDKKALEFESLQRDKLKDELGDVMWYWIRLCWVFALNPYEVLDENVAKLQKRKQMGQIRAR